MMKDLPVVLQQEILRHLIRDDFQAAKSIYDHWVAKQPLEFEKLDEQSLGDVSHDS